MTTFITSRFRRAVARLLDLEGGYVNHPNDRGKATKYGISQRAYPQLDIENLTRQAAEDIYERDYWAPLGCDMLWSERLASALFEFGVNAGIRPAAKSFQRAIVASGKAIAVDGRIGERTIAAANDLNADALLTAFRLEMLEHYEAIVRRDPSQAAFLNGWRNRVAASGGRA